jgi:hypothetical protein
VREYHAMGDAKRGTSRQLQSDSERSRSERRTQLLVAGVGIVGALLGAGVGGGVTYWVNKEQQEEEARGAARVLHENFRVADDAMARSLLDNRYRFYKLDTGLPLSDHKRLSTHLRPIQYRYVAEGTASLVLQDARSREKRIGGRQFVKDDEIQVRCVREKLARARRALREFSQLPDPKADEDVSRFSADCNRARTE